MRNVSVLLIFLCLKARIWPSRLAVVSVGRMKAGPASIRDGITLSLSSKCGDYS